MMEAVSFSILCRAVSTLHSSRDPGGGEGFFGSCVLYASGGARTLQGRSKAARDPASLVAVIRSRQSMRSPASRSAYVPPVYGVAEAAWRRCSSPSSKWRVGVAVFRSCRELFRGSSEALRRMMSRLLLSAPLGRRRFGSGIRDGGGLRIR